MSVKPSIVSVGAGNLATHLIRALFSIGHPVLSVYSRTLDSARTLAAFTGSEYTNNYAELPGNAGIYIISLTDDAIPEAVNALTGNNSIVVHTAGSVGVDVFKGKIERYGVMYPLQTFSKSRDVVFSDIPFLVEGSDTNTLTIIREIAYGLSQNITGMNSEERMWVHAAAVMACNFTNYMYTCANDMLVAKDIRFNLLFPLMTETLQKAMSENPAKVQTGPAVRGSHIVLAEHIRMLKDKPELQKLYTFVSESIIAYHHPENKQK